MSKSGKRAWLTPTLILVVILIPLVFAVLVFVQPGWFAFGHTNHGQLVRPPVKISVTGVARPGTGAGPAARERPLPADYFSGHWTLVYLGTGPCKADCKAAMYAMRQARIATGEHMRQVRRLYVATPDAAPGAGFAAQWPGVTVVVEAGPQGARFARQFTAVQPAGGIYVVDPNGLLMMTFSKHANPEGLVKDLRHLLDVNS